MLGIVSISKEFVPVFFGDGYDKVNYIIYVLSPMVLLMGIANVLGTQYLLPTKRQKEYTFSVTIGVIVNFILNYIFISLWKSIGAAIATVLSQVVVDTLQYRHVKNEISIKELIKIAWKYLISALVMFAVCFGIRTILEINIISIALENFASRLEMDKLYIYNCISIVVQVFFGAITYIVMLITLKDTYVYNFLNKLKSKFLKKKEA